MDRVASRFEPARFHLWKVPHHRTVNSHGLGRRSAMRFPYSFGNHTKDSGTLAAVAFSFC